MSVPKSLNYGDGCSRLRLMTNDNGDGVSWSDLNHHLCCLNMIQLEVIYFIAFNLILQVIEATPTLEQNQFHNIDT